MKQAHDLPIPALTAIRLTATHALREMCWSRRTLIACSLMLLPAIIALIIRLEAPPGAIARAEEAILVNLQIALVPLLSLFFGASILRDGMEDHTLAYLLTRPMGRVRIALGYLLGIVLFLLPIVWIDILATHCVLHAGRSPGPFGSEEAVQRVVTHLAVSSGAVVFYATFHVALGLLSRFPTVIGALAFTVFDFTFGFLPGPPRAISPAAHFEELFGPLFETRAQMLAMNPEPIGEGPALLRLFIVYIVLFALILRAAARRDFVSFDKSSGA